MTGNSGGSWEISVINFRKFGHNFA